MSETVKIRHAGALGWAAGAVAVAAALALGPAGPASAAGADPAARAASGPAWRVEAIPSPARAGTSEARITVEGDHVILSWLSINPQTTVLEFAERTATGWTKPQMVFASQSFFVNAFDIPSVRRLPDGTLVAHWTEVNGDNPDASKVLVSWSKDHGHTWAKPVVPHSDTTQTEHGFVSSFAAGKGFGVVWIDGRATDPDTETGDMSLRASVYDADGKVLSAEKVVDARVCECCSTAAAETSEGPIIAYRNRSADEVRDIYVTRYAGGHWTAPVDVHHDGWKINACPINGPAVAAQGKQVAVAWFMAKDNHGQAYVAFSRDAGRTFGPAVRVDDGSSLGRLGVALLPDGSAAVSWMETVNGKTLFRARRVTPRGLRGPAATVAETSGSRYARIARYGDELLFAWTASGDASQVKTARIRLR